MLRIVLFIAIITTIISCKKQDVMKYDSADALSFYYSSGEADSLSYSFSTIGFGKQTDTLFLKMRVLGSISKTARTVRLRAVSGSTARANTDYKLPEFVIPAGVTSFLYPLVIYKTPEMKTQVLRLILEVEPNADFPGIAAEGVVAGLTSADNTTSFNRIKIDFTDKLIRPSSWPSRFGTYSDVKYAFVIKTLGTGDFRLTTQGGTWTAIDLDLDRVVLRDALLTYEAANGILLDETGVRVTF